MNKIESVCVYCASSTQVSPSYFSAAHRLGQLLAQAGIRLINGAGNMGLMAATSDGCLQGGGQVTGVIPQFMVDENWHHRQLTQLIVTPDMHTRKEKMAQLSDAAIALPGGCGTIEELMEVITWKQLGLYLKPIVILNTDGYYNPLLQMLQQAVEQNFMRSVHSELWTVASTPEEAVEQLFTQRAWDANVRKIAAI